MTSLDEFARDFPRGVPGRDERNAKLATASWSFTAPAYQPGHFFLGTDFAGNRVGYKDDRHIVTVPAAAPARAAPASYRTCTSGRGAAS